MAGMIPDKEWLKRRMMKNRIKPLDLNQVTFISLKRKRHKVEKTFFANPWENGGAMTDFFNSLPGILAGKDFNEVVERIAKAFRQNKMILLGMGAHPIKVGLNPILIDLMEKGILKGIAVNGACLIHDVEIALTGHTSEEVDEELSRGTFGMVKETHETINHAIRDGVQKGWGIGESIGRKIQYENFPYKRLSLLAAGQKLGIPITAHIAIGTDINHMGPSADGAAIGQGSLQDFRTFASLVSQLEKGIFINLGSAVILPEVFLKALALARNLGHPLANLTTVNMDFIHHYRPSVNVVRRPTLKGGKGYTLIGHHELMVPLLAAAVIEKLKGSRDQGIKGSSEKRKNRSF
jgi:deoxyhypusine synthase